MFIFHFLGVCACPLALRICLTRFFVGRLINDKSFTAVYLKTLCFWSVSPCFAAGHFLKGRNFVVWKLSTRTITFPGGAALSVKKRCFIGHTAVGSKICKIWINKMLMCSHWRNVPAITRWQWIVEQKKAARPTRPVIDIFGNYAVNCTIQYVNVALFLLFMHPLPKRPWLRDSLLCFPLPHPPPPRSPLMDRDYSGLNTGCSLQLDWSVTGLLAGQVWGQSWIRPLVTPFTRSAQTRTKIGKYANPPGCITATNQ